MTLFEGNQKVKFLVILGVFVSSATGIPSEVANKNFVKQINKIHPPQSL